MMNIYNPSTQEVKPEGSEVQDYLYLCVKSKAPAVHGTLESMGGKRRERTLRDTKCSPIEEDLNLSHPWFDFSTLLIIK